MLGLAVGNCLAGNGQYNGRTSRYILFLWSEEFYGFSLPSDERARRALPAAADVGRRRVPAVEVKLTYP